MQLFKHAHSDNYSYGGLNQVTQKAYGVLNPQSQGPLSNLLGFQRARGTYVKIDRSLAKQPTAMGA